MRNNKYKDQLHTLLKQPFFTLKSAQEEGVPQHVIAYWTSKGTLERICPGVYRSSTYEPEVAFEWENLALIAASIPESVICLISALCYYELTDQIMRESWVAIPHKMRSPKRPHSRIVRMRNIELGKQKIRLGEYNVHIFDRERTIIDAFRYLSKEIALKALKRYFTNTDYKPQPRKLLDYAKRLRTPITPYLLAYTT